MAIDIESEIKTVAPDFAQQIQMAAAEAHNEAEFRTRVTSFIEEFADKVKLPIYLREEYTLIDGRADAVYNRLVIEYEPPSSLRQSNSYGANQHAIEQVERYMKGLVRRERHKPERLAGVVLDGHYFIFVRSREGIWQEDRPVSVESSSAERFLKLLASLSTELALIPDNLIRDFGENTLVSRKAVSALYTALTETQNPKVKKLFEQWSLQFGEVCDYERASKLKVDSFARRFGITGGDMKPFHFFFCLHTYYATFIKLLAVQVVHYYAMPKLGTDIRQAATFGSQQLRAYLENMEEGGIFREFGIANFLEGDFFRWYLDVWDELIYQAAKEIVSTLANYSLVTLDVDPDSTRDLLKKLYQQLMPGELRHNLGEYYTPDWLAERLLNMLEAGKFEGNPDKRLLDPACGSGTFLVIAIKKIREYTVEKMLPESQVLEKILSNIVGFDLNPLAVISTRTNYLLALGDLLQHRKGDINIPVYLCDSIMTPQEGKDLFSRGVLRFNTAVGPFSLPKSLIQAHYIDKLSNLLEESVKLNLSKEQFTQRLCQELPLIPEQDNRDIEVVSNLYENLLTLQRQGVNGIWARIIKNAFAPLFAEEFDYVAGNPPWVNWEHLPENYRNEMIPLYEDVYGLFPHVGFRRRHGSAKVDISTLMTYVSLDKYLKRSGKLGFLITQSVFKTDAGKGFRRFALPDDKPIQALYVDDMTAIKPFEGVGNRTSIVILQKGKATKYPVPYNYWIKRGKGEGIKDSLPLKEVTEIATYKKFVAEPVDKNDPTSLWLTGKPKALKGVKKALGKSDYTAHAGVCGWANSIYWVNIVDRRPNGLVVVSNITEGAKRKVESIQMAIEADLVYPLLRGRDISRWKAEPSACIIVPQDPSDPKHGYPIESLQVDLPKTYLYLNRFEPVLSKRPGYIKYINKEPFYSLYDIKAYTFALYKVVWTRIATVQATVVSTLNGKSVIPQETITLVGCNTKDEAHYIASLINSSIFQYAVTSYSQAGGKSMGSMHVLENIRIPKFDPGNKIHQELAGLSQNARYAVTIGDEEGLIELEQRIDELAAQIWGLTTEELAEIKSSLEDLL